VSATVVSLCPPSVRLVASMSLCNRTSAPAELLVTRCPLTSAAPARRPRLPSPRRVEVGEMSQEWQRLLDISSPPWLACADGLSPLPSPSAAATLRPPPGLPPPPGLALPWLQAAVPPPPTPPALPGAVDLATAFMAGVQFASRGMKTCHDLEDQSLGKAFCTTDPSDQTSDTCSTADPAEELLTPQLTPGSTSLHLEREQGLGTAEQPMLNEEACKLPFVLDLSAALTQASPGCGPRGLPEQCGSPVPVPSLGSVHHHLGLCKPCDFVGRSLECRSGADCRFCHLCGPAERRQRKMQRRKCVRAAARSQAALQVA